MSSLSPQPVAICVLGAHRSGTSAVSRAINLLGAYLGEPEHLMPPLPENPKGFWEHMEIYHLHERILAACGRTWDSSIPLPAGWQQAPALAPLSHELAQLVQKRFASHVLWMWKDPRTCLLLPLWRKLLSDMSVKLRVLFVVRNPLDVARSLHRRNNYPIDKGFGIWLNYNLVALRSITGLDIVWLSYDNFLENWYAELRRCALGLKIPWPADPSFLYQEMRTFVQSNLRHSMSTNHTLLNARPPWPIVRLYKLMQQFLDTGYTPSFTNQYIDQLYNDFISWARIFAHNIS